MHQLIHDESGAGHVPGVFHDGKEKIQYQYVRQEHKDTPHSRDNPIDEDILEPPLFHEISNEPSELGHKPVYPVHRILPKGECRLEDYVEDQDEYRESCPFVRDNGVDLLGP